MRSVLASFVVFAVALGLSAAPIPKVKPKDAVTIQGTWEIEKFDTAGGPGPAPAEIAQMKLVFKDKTFKMTAGEQIVITGEFKLDPDAKLKTIDIVGKDRTYLGIYELDGDTLKLCLAEGQDAPRPTEMKADGKRISVVTLKRVKAEKKDK